MEKNNVTITIQSLQSMETGQETMTQHTEGRLFREGAGYVLTYREGEDSGLGQTRTTLTITPDRGVVMTREGEVTTRMEFRMNEMTMGNYKSPYGRMNLLVLTHSLWAEVDEDEGLVKLDYQLYLRHPMGNQDVSRNTLSIYIRRKDKETTP